MNHTRINAALCLPLLLALISCPTFVHGWGKEGHEMVANIAYGRLANETQSVVKNILRREDGSYGDDDDAGSPLASVANWADKVRFTKTYHWSTPLHFIDVRDKEIVGGCPCTSNTNMSLHKATACRFVYQRDCANDVCVAGAIVNYTTQLGHRNNMLNGPTSASTNSSSMKSASTSLRGSVRSNPIIRESLMFLTHFVGDIHQPLHSARASDKGGNAFEVHFNHALTTPIQQRDGTYHSHWNLHSVWDAGIIERAISELYKSREGFEDALVSFIHIAEESGEINKWLQCADGRDKKCVSQWAEESLEDALRWAYENSDGTEVVDGSVLTDEYYQTRLPVVTRSLAAAGVRLAASLELALGKSSGQMIKIA